MLISDIIDELITEVGGDTSDTALSTKMLGFFKSALRRFPRHTRTRLLLDTSSSALAVGTNYITPMPNDFIKERAVYYTESGNRIDIPKISFDDFNDQYNSNSSNAPQGYRIVGAKMEFLNNADREYTIYVEYFKSVDDIAAGDTFFGSSDMIEIAKDGAKYYYYSYEEDSPMAASSLALLKAGLDKLETDFLNDEIPNYIEES